MAVKFKPIVFNEGDFRAFKYKGQVTSAAIQEGQLCVLATSANLNIVGCDVHNGIVSTQTDLLGTIQAPGQYFAVFREDPDVESVDATINIGEFVIGFPLKTGNEFEIHESVTESGFASSWSAIGQAAVLGSTGKFTPFGGSNAQDVILAECLGTFNAQWIRLRAL